MKIVLASILSVFTLQSMAQSTILGKFLDETENAPIAYVSSALYSQVDSSLVAGVVSGLDGEFTFKNIKPGKYYLVAQFMGFEHKQISNLAVAKNQTLDLGKIIMKANQKLLDEIVVSGERVTTMHKVDRAVFDAGSFQSSQGGTATDVLRNLPAISVNAQGEITARGATGFVVLINGKPTQGDPTMILAQLPANAIKSIELITAPSAKYDPEGKAGIINILTSTGATDGLFVQVNARLGAPSIKPYGNAESAQRYGTDLTVNYRKGKWDWSLGASFLRNDIAGRREGDVYTIIEDTTTRFPSDGERSFDEVNVSGRATVGFAPSEKDNFSLGMYAGKRSKDRTADILYYDNHGSVKGNRIYTTQYFNENLENSHK